MLEPLVAWILSYDVLATLIVAGIMGLLFYLLIVRSIRSRRNSKHSRKD